MCLPSNCLESRSEPHAISHFSTRKCRAHASSQYLVLVRTQQMDHSIISGSVSTKQMGRLGTWYLEVRSRWIVLAPPVAFKRRASFRRCGHNDEVGADTPPLIIHWLGLFVAKLRVRVRVRVRVTSPGFATPASMKCAVQVWSGRLTVVRDPDVVEARSW